MARVYVTLDLETTGLDAARDKITEVGAVRFRGDRILEEFQSLVNPGINIPYQIQQLTGITNQMVADAPQFGQIRAKLQRFVGNTPIIGHNIGFDLKFLQAYNLFQDNARIDTFEIASILLPHADRYSLHALGKLLEIEEPATHRALDDALVTHRLFEALLDQARRLDGETIQEVAEMATRSRWSLSLIFKDLSRERSRFTTSLFGQQLANKKGLLIEDELPPPLKPIKPPRHLDIDELAALLEPDGLFESQFTKFEHRSQQVDMLRNVADAFNEPYHLVVEAGTGTGKSMAYLIPAIYWSHQNNTRVVISTNTINLQDQLLNKDLPDLKQALDLDIRVTALKGRGNYICSWRVDHLRRKPNLSPLEMRLLAKIMIWLPNTLTGDKQELFIPDPGEQVLWHQVNANTEICPPDRCAREGCFFARARQAAEAAHIIVVNHALLLADIAVSNRAIPEYKYLIIDEAHHLENSVTKQLSFSINRKGIEQLFTGLSQNKDNLFTKMAAQIKSAGLRNILSDMEHLARSGSEAANKAARAWATLFNVLERFIAEFIGRSRNDYDRKLRISARMRIQPAWSDVELAWDNANTSLTSVIEAVTKASKLWDSLDTYDVEDWEDTMLLITNYRLQLDEVKQKVGLILGEGDENTITWLEEKVKSQDISLFAAPLHVGNLVQQHLFDRKESIILTSATLRTDSSFEYMKERLNAWDVGEIAVGSPFDYQNSTMVYIPTNIPEPGSHGFQKVFAQTLTNLAIATKGRILVLFTSYSHLRTTASDIRQPLAQHDIVVYQQGAGVGRRQLLENFKSADQAVLMGTRSFWEGVDIPGPALSCVVIAKLPFSVPNDPIFQARSETFDNAFTEYSIPETILHFRQGFGRLIRTRSDRGVVVIMDRRVISKNYGHAFLEALPEVTLQQGLTADLPNIAAQWIDKSI